MLRLPFSNICSLFSKVLPVNTQPVKEPVCSFAQTRLFSLSSSRNLKEIHEKTEGNVTKIEGHIVQSERAQNVVPREGTGCTLCKIHPHLRYTDVLILSQFVRPDGCLLPRWVTGVCRSQQYRLAKLVHQAQRAGLMPQLRPELASGKKRVGHKSNYKWKRYNVYFKE